MPRYDFKMPSLGADMDSGTLVEWRIHPGDKVKRGDIVAIVETQKAAVEIEIWESGVVDSLLAKPGENVPVGTVIATLTSDAALPADKSTQSPTPITPDSPPQAEVVTVVGKKDERPSIAPGLRKLARELGVDITSLTGTGPQGTLSRTDIEAAANKRNTLPKSNTEDRKAAMRQAIAAAMSKSKREIPHYYLSDTIDMGRAFKWLSQTNERRQITERLLPVALLLKAVALAAQRVPSMNGFWNEGAFHPSDSVHVGVAISLRQGGLIAPALRDTDKKTLSEIMAALKDLVARTRTGTLRSSEMTDATVTVTNLGEKTVESVYGVIYPPQVALVGFGKIEERPIVFEGAVVARPCVSMTLSADHRASDGHRGALFLSAINRLLQSPEEL